ncbi:beta-lactamase family protein [Candidatus Bipolaricaulota bacterium]|nr:beta-lactamase family protein [Candidatus Bipolaricaulota bacterium]TFH08889.1 MAG: class A beta-lactamase-related serine hydrolase [Candidatus Atribacteria bacterium]
MRDILGTMLIGLVAIGTLLGVTGDVVDVLQREPAPIEARLQRVLDRGVESRRSSYPGAVLYVDSEPSGIWSGVAGLANAATGEAMTADSRFCIGSITKTFVATVVLQLMEEGVIDLDASIDIYLPENLPVAISNMERITVRMLLNHTSGIPEWLTEDVIARLTEDPSTVWKIDEVLRIAMAQDMPFEPGEGYAYSNTDYTILGLIIEEQTGVSWEDQVRARVLDPLDLIDTVIRNPGETSPLPRMARGYVAMGRDLMDLTLTDPSMAGAAGGNVMVSTAKDLAYFITALLDGELFTSAQTLDEMLGFVDAPDENGIPYWYGLGLERYDIDGVNFIGHAGGAVGYSTVMYVAPDAGITLVASHNAYDLGAAYLDLMIPALKQLGK